jgi:membrane-associated phospholipid phosphatase
MFALFLIAYQVLYVLPNFRPFVEPMYLPMFSVDLLTPLMPWTFVIYLSDYLVVPWVVYELKRRDEFYSFARNAFGVLILSGIWFMFCPTRYPRPPYPEPPNFFVGWLMSIIANLDTPNNCFPSMHVALSAVAAWAMRHRGPKVLLAYSLWAVSIFISTLTTKQHYLLDIAGGLTNFVIVATLDHVIFYRQLHQRVWSRVRAA